jgi:putative copper export protein
VLNVSGPTLVLWMHIVAACIWIGGQVTVAAIIPLLRDQGELARRVGRRYQTVAWPAFAVLIVTGVVNIGNAGLHWSQLLDNSAGRTLVFKLVLVALSGLAAGVHSFLQAPRRVRSNGGSAVGSAVLGSISLVAALLAALYGVAIAGA